VNDYKKNKKISLTFLDKNRTPLINKKKQTSKQKVINQKIDDFTAEGFDNIILAGHSSGVWASINLKSRYPKKIKGVIAFQLAFAGKIKSRKSNPFWEEVKNYGISLINVSTLKNILVYVHEKDVFENTKTLSFLSNLKTVKFIDLSDTKCKGKVMRGGHHGITLTKCFADEDNRSGEITKYLEEIY
tara:strand:- start:70 stop:630 length:561 start_codon:yes stop_codon:yes gene_type:complete